MLLEKLEQWEMLEAKQNGGDLGFRQPDGGVWKAT